MIIKWINSHSCFEKKNINKINQYKYFGSCCVFQYHSIDSNKVETRVFGSLLSTLQKSNNENGPEKRLYFVDSDFSRACVSTWAFVSFELNGGWNWKIAYTMHYAYIQNMLCSRTSQRLPTTESFVPSISVFMWNASSIERGEIPWASHIWP